LSYLVSKLLVSSETSTEKVKKIWWPPASDSFSNFIVLRRKSEMSTLKDVDDLLESLEQAFEFPVNPIEHGSSEDQQKKNLDDEYRKKRLSKQLRSPTVAKEMGSYPTFDEFLNSASESDSSFYDNKTNEDKKRIETQKANNAFEVSSNSSGVEYSSDYLKLLRDPSLSVRNMAQPSTDDYPVISTMATGEIEVEIPDQLQLPPLDPPPLPPGESFPRSASEDEARRSPPIYDPPSPKKTNSDDTIAQLEAMAEMMEKNFSEPTMNWESNEIANQRQNSNSNPPLKVQQQTNNNGNQRQNPHPATFNPHLRK
jgi:hypothetical protein